MPTTMNAPTRTGYVLTAPFLEIAARRLSEGETWGTMASRAGMLDRRPRRGPETPDCDYTDTSRFRRLIGDTPTISGGGHTSHKVWVSLRTAAILCEGLMCDPVDVGL